MVLRNNLHSGFSELFPPRIILFHLVFGILAVPGSAVIFPLFAWEYPTHQSVPGSKAALIFMKRHLIVPESILIPSSFLLLCYPNLYLVNLFSLYFIWLCTALFFWHSDVLVEVLDNLLQELANFLKSCYSKTLDLLSLVIRLFYKCIETKSWLMKLGC